GVRGAGPAGPPGQTPPRGLARCEPVDLAAERDRVELALPVLAERRKPGQPERLLAGASRPSADDAQRPDLAAAVVSVEVAAACCRDGAAAVDEAAGDRAGLPAQRVDRDGKDEPSCCIRL